MYMPVIHDDRTLGMLSHECQAVLTTTPILILGSSSIEISMIFV
jgi:hypothetical protein